jgi:hypothetical protein
MKITLTYKQHQTGVEFVKTFDSWIGLNCFLNSGKFGDIYEQFDVKSDPDYDLVTHNGKTIKLENLKDWCEFLLPIALSDYTYTLEVQP